MTEHNDKKRDYRPPGTGSLKFKGKDAKGRDVWGARICVGHDADGKRISLNKTIHGTRTKAQAWLTDQLAKKDAGATIFKTKTTLAEYLQKWLTDVAKPRVSEGTFNGYVETLTKRVINKPIGRLKLTALRPQDIQALYSDVSAPSARHIHAPLRSALSQAVKWQLIHTNPCDGVELPRHKAREIQTLTQAEANRLLAVERFTRKVGERELTVENKFGVLFAFLLEVGTRPSEALGLFWADLDLDKGVVTIRRTLQWHSGKGEGHYFDEPKTKHSRRSVTLSANLVQRLREHRAVQGEALLKLGVRSELVFSNSEGMPIQRKNLIRRHYKPALKAAGLPATLTLYSLRHSCATLLLQNGTHPKVVAERLGHASTVLTLDTYSHVTPGMQEGATARLEAMLYG